MGEWVLYTQPNYAHPKPTHLTPLTLIDKSYLQCPHTGNFIVICNLYVVILDLYYVHFELEWTSITIGMILS